MKTHFKTVLAFSFLFIAANVGAQTLKDARRLTDNEQYEKARAAFKTLVEKEPTNGDNFFYFGDLMLKMENPDSARILFQKGVDINPTNALTHVGLGRYFMYTGDVTKAQQEITYAKSLVATQAGKKGLDMAADRQTQIYLEIAETNTWAGKPNAGVPNYDDAINLTNMAEKLTPKSPDVFLIRGDALYKKDPVNGTPAIGAYMQASKLDPKNCIAYVRIGLLYANGKNMPVAINFYNQAIKIDSTFAPAWRLKGEAEYMQGKSDSAAYCIATYLRLNNSPTARYRYTAFLYTSGNYADAITQGELTLKSDSSKTVIYRIIARSYLENKTPDPAKAIEYFNKFFAKQKISGAPALLPDDYIYRARAYSRSNQDSLAIIDYGSGLKLDSTRRDIYFDMATSYYKMKKYDMAGVYYKKKIDANPAAATLSDWVAYGRALQIQKEFVRADSAFRVGVALEPKNPAGWFYLARTNYQMDPDYKLDSARVFYETYYDLAIKDKEKNKKDLIVAGKYLASYHFIHKNFACSKAWFTFVLELDPTNADVKAQLTNDKDIKAAATVDLSTCKPAAK